MSQNDTPKIEWYWMGQNRIQPNENRVTFPESVLFYNVLETGKQAHWSIDLVNMWILASRYEPRIPLPGRKPHADSLLEEKDIHHVKPTSVSKDNPDRVATVPGEMMEEFGGQHRGEILTENPELWFRHGEICHFTASNAMIISRVLYILKEDAGRDFISNFVDINVEDYFIGDDALMTDGGGLDLDSFDESREVLNLTAGEVMSFEEARNRIEEQRQELETWLERQRTGVDETDDAGESVQLTETDEGKKVVTSAGEILGMISRVTESIAFVDPTPGIADRQTSKLGWDNIDDEGIPLPEESIDRVTDEKVILK